MLIFLDGETFSTNSRKIIVFRYEKDMIPVLKNQLSKMYKTEYILPEFDSGNGIADLVFAIDVDSRNGSLVEYDLLFEIMNSFNKKNKRIKVKDYLKKTFLNKRKVTNLIDFLVINGFAEKIDADNILVVTKYKPPIKRIISIEAKLSDWKSGLYQALRYKAYSHKSYLAISKEFAHRVDKDLLKQHNIGLIVVNSDTIEIAIDVKNEKPSNNVAQAYLSEKMANLVFA